MYPTESINRADPNKRFLLVTQSRDTWDALIPFRRHIGEFALGLKGTLQFVCYAETHDETKDPQSRLNGRVFIITNDALWKDKVSPQIERCSGEMKKYVFTSSSGPIDKAYAKPLSELDDVCSDCCAFQGSFSLKRNGIIEFDIDHEMKTEPKAPRLPADDEAKRHLRHILAAQLFSFMRDIGHKHQHHSPKSDTIVDLYEYDGNDDRKWRTFTLYSIYRRIISYKRRSEIDQQIFGLGLLAYAKAFRKVCCEDGISDLPTYFDAELRESIQATELRIRHLSQTASERSATLRTIVLALAALIVSMSGIVKLSSPSPQTAIDVAPEWVALSRLIAGHPIPFFLLITTLVMYSISLKNRQSRPEVTERGRRSQGRTQVFSREVAVAIRIAWGLLLLGAVGALIYFAWVAPNVANTLAGVAL